MSFSNKQIFLKGVDKTAEIASFYKKGNLFHIKFKHSPKEYFYPEESVEIQDLQDATKFVHPVYEYLRRCAEFSPLKNDNEENLLLKAFVAIRKVDENSALASYIDPVSRPPKWYAPRSLIFPFGCNESQYNAVQGAFCCSMSIIQGPPGTGKTQTILNIVANLVTQGKSVLVVSQNNEAIANVREKLAKKEYGLDFIVASMGKRESVENFMADQKTYPSYIQEWGRVGVKKSAIYHDSQRLLQFFKSKEQIASLKLERKNLELEYKYFLEIKPYNNPRVLKKLSKRFSFRLVDLYNSLLESGRNKQAFGLFKRIQLWLSGFRSLKFKNILPNQVFCLLKEAFYISRQKEISAEINRLEKRCKSVNPQKVYDDSLGYFKNYVLKKISKKERPVFSVVDWSRRINEFVEEYPIVLSTTFSSRNCLPFGQADFLYDYVIIDEASQVDIVTGAMALSCAKNAVIVGDDKQLPNVVRPEDLERANWIFEKSGIPDAYRYSNSFLSSVNFALKSIPKILLKEHYRCHPKIIDFCNHKFYNGQLSIMTEDHGETDVFIVVKTPAGNHCRTRYNQREIDTIREEILPKLKESEIANMGVIAPYNNQADAIRAQLNLESSTVHKFQGKERDIILLSTTDNQVTEFSDDPHLLNVAISRAKNKLIVVTTGNEIAKDSNLSDLLGYIEYNGFEIRQGNVNSIFDCLYSNCNRTLKNRFGSKNTISKYESENIMYRLLLEVLAQPEYSVLHVLFEIPMKDILGYELKKSLSNDEFLYAIDDWTHVDFAIFNKLTKRLVCVVEVDGYAYHKKGTKQNERDSIKNRILEKAGIIYERFSTVGSDEKKRIIALIEKSLKN